AVEDSRPHEVGVGHLTDDGGTDLAPLLLAQLRQCGEPAFGDGHELGQDFAAGGGAAGGDPGLVLLGQRRPDVVAERAVPGRRRLTEERALYADEVRELALDAPSGALGRSAPLRRAQPTAEVGQGSPCLRQGRGDLPALGRPWSGGAVHRRFPVVAALRSTDPRLPFACLAEAEHPPLRPTPPLTFDAIRGFTDVEELAWRITRDTA